MGKTWRNVHHIPLFRAEPENIVFSICWGAAPQVYDSVHDLALGAAHDFQVIVRRDLEVEPPKYTGEGEGVVLLGKVPLQPEVRESVGMQRLHEQAAFIIEHGPEDLQATGYARGSCGEHQSAFKTGNLLPNLPGGLPGMPQGFEEVLVAQRVHRLPEPRVLESNQFAVPRQFLHGVLLQDGLIVGKVFEDGGLHHEETGVDPRAVPLGLLQEVGDEVILCKFHRTEPATRLASRHGDGLAVRLMEIMEFPDVDIGDPIPIRQHERFVPDI